jgi:rsbT antagonist protein RsbS
VSPTADTTTLPALIKTHETDLLQSWVTEQFSALRGTRIRESELRAQSAEFLNLLQLAMQSGNLSDINATEYSRVRDMLGDLSRARARQGFSPTETATFVLSLKQTVFARIRQELSPAQAADVMWDATQLLDKLALYTTELHQKGREEIINRQQQELLELSTPVVKLWDGVLAPAHRRDGRRGGDHRHHGRADGGYTDRATSLEDGDGRSADGRRLHHQRHPAADRADHRPPRRRSGGRDHQGDAGRRVSHRAHAHGSAGARQQSAGLIGGAANMERIPILKMGDILLVTIQVDMHDRLATQLQEDLTARISETEARGVLIDISALEIVDSFIGRMIANIAAMSRVLDASTVLVGMQPAVAITLVELGLTLPGVRTALDVDRGMRLLGIGTSRAGVMWERTAREAAADADADAQV